MRKWIVMIAVISGTAFPVKAHNENIYFSKAVYYDTNADGFIDSIVLTHSGPIFEGDISTLRQHIHLPDWRNFSAGFQILLPTDNTVVLIVREYRDTPITSVTSGDFIRFSEVLLPGKGYINANALTPLDSVAPVLQKAQLISYGDIVDSLRVVFSEKIRVFNHGRPFLFITPQGTSYLVNISSVALSDSILTAIPTNVSYMNQGDSVWINPSASITDNNGNIQNNPDNRRVPLEILQFDDLITFSNAAYYDSNADGFIDSIIINTAGPIGEYNLGTIITMINLPGYRNFTIVRTSLIENSIIMIVNENNDEPNTAVNDSDRIVITQGVISGKALVVGTSIKVQDRVAPVILWAHLESHDVGDDTIFLKFSEQVNSINNWQPFRFLRPGEGEYEVTIRPVFQNNEGRFIGQVVSVTLDSLMIGDSVWINTAASISDMLKNVQRNPGNRRVPLTINLFDIPVEFTYAAYFDSNKDGFIDLIKMRYRGPLHSNDLASVRAMISLPAFRYFSIISIISFDSTINITIKENSKIPRTAVFSEDKIKIKAGHLPEGGYLVGATISVLDSVAPVISSSHLDWYNRNQQILRVTFSEPVRKIFSNQPFLFKKPLGEQYIVFMMTNNLLTNSNYTGQVQNIDNLNGIEVNDSIWIFNNARISDLKNNVQTSYINRKVPITVSYHFQMRYLAENNPFSEGKRPVPQQVEQAYVNNNQSLPSDGMVIIVEPDRDITHECPLNGTVSIYDVVSNPVIEQKSMVFDNGTNRLYYVWDGRNYNGRKVGTGTYLAVINVNKQGQKFCKKLKIGVKR